MEEWEQQEQQEQQEQATAERILGQTAALLRQREDNDAVQLLLLVRRLEFEQTSDGFTDDTNWHDYYWAAVFFVDERVRPRFTDTALQHLQPLLIEVARQNGKLHVDRIHIKPFLPEVGSDWRHSHAATPVASDQSPAAGAGEVRGARHVAPKAAPSSRPVVYLRRRTGTTNHITAVTRRRLFTALRDSGVAWSGGLDEVAFLSRLYDLDRLESTDTRFATAKGDIFQHRYNNPGDWDDDWIFTDSRFQLDRGPDDVLLCFLEQMVHPEVRTDDNEAEQLLYLLNSALAPDGFRLSPVDTISGYPVYEAFRLIPRPQREPSTRPHETPGTPDERSTAGQDGYEAVRSQACGDPKAYRRKKDPLPAGNQADVFEATHKNTGVTVAMKQLRAKIPAGMKAARMKREIEAGTALAGHPHAMPILDHAANHTWFVMPWADETAEKHSEALKDPKQLRPLIDALTSVLAEAHRLGWIHRDIKPPNILLLNGQWVLADWGIVRRPAGQTTKVGRTAAVGGVGTEGFTAPELFTHPDERPQPSSDIYSVGRMIAWALTGEKPMANKELLPAPGPWRNIVRAATQEDPSRRPQSISELTALIEREHAAIPVDPPDRARTLLEQANRGDIDAADALVALLTDHADDYDLYVGMLTDFSARHAAPAFARNLGQARTVLRGLTAHVDGDGTRRVQFGDAARVTIWLQGIAAYAAAKRQWDLLEEAMQGMCTWDGAWDQWSARDRITPWLASLTGEAAASAAGILRDHPDSARHFSNLADDQTTDLRIRHTVRPPAFVPAQVPATPRTGDVDKAARLLQLLPQDGPWYRWLVDAETMFRVPLTVSDLVCDAHRPLETDIPDYVDPELQDAHHDLVVALGALCFELNGMTDISDEGPSVLEINHPGTSVERNALNRQACQARDQFVPAYTKVINLLNVKGVLPLASATLPAPSTSRSS
ncbi:AbiJ-related protein [Streptomyces hydrogenans]|uniref:AbiJ-related protein n=1 Tax=Streptomyces hydrogenans TaxID=1873719 RepID=UPI0038286DC6